MLHNSIPTLAVKRDLLSIFDSTFNGQIRNPNIQSRTFTL